MITTDGFTSGGTGQTGEHGAVRQGEACLRDCAYACWWKAAVSAHCDVRWRRQQDMQVMEGMHGLDIEASTCKR